MINCYNLRKNYLYKDKWFLFFAYSVDKMSANKIAKICNYYYPNKILDSLRRFKIKIRTRSEASKIRSNKENSNKIYTNKEFLYICHIVCKMNPPEISKICKCCSSTIRYWLCKYNIFIKTYNTSNKLYNNKEFLYICYIVCEMSLKEMGRMCGCTDKTILRYLYKFNIPIRTPSERQKICSNTIEAKKNYSKSQKEKWKQIKFREKTIKSMKIAQNRPEVREKRRITNLKKRQTTKL